MGNTIPQASASDSLSHTVSNPHHRSHKKRIFKERERDFKKKHIIEYGKYDSPSECFSIGSTNISCLLLITKISHRHIEIVRQKVHQDVEMQVRGRGRRSQSTFQRKSYRT